MENKARNLKQFKLNNKAFIVNPYSMSIVQIGNRYADKITQLIPDVDGNNKENTKSLSALPEKLQKSLMLLDDQKHIESPSVCFKPKPLNAFAINLTHNCNLDCTYCYAQKNYLKVIPQKANMSEDTADSVLNFIFNQSALIGERLQIVFFGGEPMLNFDLLKYIVHKSFQRAEKEKLEISYSISTNGTILNEEQLDFFDKYYFSIQVSFDGVRKLQNKNRPFLKSDRESYVHVLNNIKLLINRSLNFEIRATAPAHECEFSDIARSLLDIGIYSFSIRPTSNASDWDSTTFREIENSLTKWADEYAQLIKKQNFIYRDFEDLIRQIHYRCPKFKACSACIDRVAIGYDGKIWPCYRWMGNEYQKWQLGHVENGISSCNLVKNIAKVNINNRVNCSQCWARLFCGGNCLITKDVSFTDSQDCFCYPALSRYECEYTKLRYKIAAWLYSELYQTAPETLKKIIKIA